ncbi:hypothetical protein HOY80DRAFT_1026783 [Tuber brumale]|nr:hypothetical protein HOY80DRAFT_1026783 [Tuber brumale]
MGYEQNELVDLVTNSMNTNNKILFLQKRLTGGRDFLEKGGCVSMVTNLRRFRTVFDTKRKIITVGNTTLFDTMPFKTVEEAAFARGLLNTMRTSIYSDAYSITRLTSNNSVIESIKQILRIFAHVKNYNLSIIDKQLIYSYINNIKTIDYKMISQIIQDICLNKVLLDNLEKEIVKTQNPVPVPVPVPVPTPIPANVPVPARIPANVPIIKKQNLKKHLSKNEVIEKYILDAAVEKYYDDIMGNLEDIIRGYSRDHQYNKAYINSISLNRKKK